MDEINQQKPGKSEGSESFGSFRLVGFPKAAVIWGKSTLQKSNIK